MGDPLNTSRWKSNHVRKNENDQDRAAYITNYRNSSMWEGMSSDLRPIGFRFVILGTRMVGMGDDEYCTGLSFHCFLVRSQIGLRSV